MMEDRIGSKGITTPGCPPGSEVDTHSARWGIDLFIEDGAYTTLAAAVTILVVLALTFSSVTAVWSMARAGDVQVSADSAALAGANVISSYYTAATVVDACIASLGFAGLIVSGAGLVTVFIPGARWSAPKIIKTGTDMLKARNSFAKTASKGLQALEKALPFLAGANGMRICSAQSGEQVFFTGVALPIPAKSASEFPALEGKEVDTDEIEEAHEDLEEAADELEEVREKTAEAKERAWRADCGRAGRNMQERASSLTGLSAVENPDYTSSLTWKPQVGLDRARAYYRWRYENERPERDDAESCADSAARKVFYRYAYDRLVAAHIDDTGDRVTSTVPLLPRNTAEVKRTTLYTDLVWPSTVEPEGLTIHYASDCPGATGDAARKVSLKDEDVGTVRECDVCKFSVGDVGRTPAASTSINNGFEYHLREFTLALNDYVACRNDEIEAEREVEGEAEDAGGVFETALNMLKSGRPRIAPPGRYGCLALAVSSDISTPEELETSFSEGADLGVRGAISAAVLATDQATYENNVLSSFFSSLKSKSSGGVVVPLLGSVLDLWGKLLVGYGNLADGLSSLTDGMLSSMESVGAGPLADLLGGMISSAVETLGLEPVDMSLHKPVLTDTANVLAHASAEGLGSAQELLRRVPISSTDPADIMEAVGYGLVERVSQAEFTIAEIPVPFGEPIPLTIRVSDLLGAVG